MAYFYFLKCASILKREEGTQRIRTNKDLVKIRSWVAEVEKALRKEAGTQRMRGGASTDSLPRRTRVRARGQAVVKYTPDAAGPDLTS